MNRRSKLLGALSVFCLLSTHASGLHLHVDEVGRNAGLHGTHTHHAHRADHNDLTSQESAGHRGDLHAHPSSDHNHAEESDVSLFEQVTSSPQSDLACAAIEETSLASVAVWIQINAPAPTGVSHYDKSCIHWRPPLRAPPHIS